MRVTENMKYNSTLDSLFTAQSQYTSLLEKMATQKRVNRPSDDPVGMTQILEMRSQQAAVTQYQTNISTAKSWVSMTESQLTAANDILVKVRELAVSSATGTATAATRANAATQVASLREEMLAIANARLGDRYLFAGSSTAAPFNEAYEYVGNNQQLSLAIGAGISLNYNVTGAQAFTDEGGGSVDIFGVLTDLEQSLKANDTAGIQQSLNGIDQSLNQVNVNVARCGTMTNRLEIAKTNLDNLTTQLTTTLSNVEDADMAELATKYAMKQVALQASYTMAGKLNEITILDYLK